MARVLIIDDSSTVSAALAVALRYDGHETATLAEFAELGAVLERFKPELIVLDLLMPGFSGIQFARFVQRFFADPPPIILHSGSDPEMMKIAAREIKPVEIVPKGTSERDVRRAVARALADRRARPANDTTKTGGAAATPRRRTTL